MSILFNVPQGSILRPLLFMIYICDLFILSDHLEFGSYADDNIHSVYVENFDKILRELEKHEFRKKQKNIKISERFYRIVFKAHSKV